MFKYFFSIIIISNFLLSFDPFERNKFFTKNNYNQISDYYMGNDLLGLNELLPLNDSTLYVGLI